MSSMESLDKLQAELSGNVYADAFHTLYKLSQDVSVEHSELMGHAMKWVCKERIEPLEAENAKLRELLQEALASHEKMCTQRGNCFGCQFFETERSRACPIVTVIRSARELGIEVEE